MRVRRGGRNQQLYIRDAMADAESRCRVSAPVYTSGVIELSHYTRETRACMG